MAELQDKIASQLLEALKGPSNKAKWKNCKKQYPWYPVPWLMLADTSEKRQKAALWFNDEHRIHWLLSGQSWQKDEWLKDQLARLGQPESTSPVLESEEGTEDHEWEKTPDSMVSEDEMEAVEIPGDVENEVDIATSEVENYQERPDEQSTESIENQPEAEVGGQAVHELLDAELVETIEEQANNFEAEETVAQAMEELPNEVETLGSDELPSEPIIVAESETIEKEIENTESIAVVDSATQGPAPRVETEEEIISANTHPEPEATATDPVVVPIPGPAIMASAPKGGMLFSPFYSVDYFASQGIKVDPATFTQSKFDTQVRSFTQWLKTMKRVNTADASLPPDPLVDAQAVASVSEKDIITEAMVEVLLKQGKYKKATEILEKLILLHPEKSTFFAARIEIIKEK